jgi:hypothetical protein
MTNSQVLLVEIQVMHPQPPGRHQSQSTAVQQSSHQRFAPFEPLQYRSHLLF